MTNAGSVPFLSDMAFAGIPPTQTHLLSLSSLLNAKTLLALELFFLLSAFQTLR